MTATIKKYYHSRTKRLVYIGLNPNADAWDQCWENEDLQSLFHPSGYSMEDKMIMDTTKKYLSTGSNIIEGGCGLGDKVYFLSKAGYRVVGVDFAVKTIQKVHQFMPQLDIRYGDLLHLEFNDSCFDGYWSFGVIEHFYGGYERIVREMWRVLKPGGYLFLTVPAMSRLRKAKAKMGLYPLFDENKGVPTDFYQFAYNSNEIREGICKIGFRFIENQCYAVREGVRSEIPGSRYLIGFLLRYFERTTWRILGDVCNHMELFVFQKKIDGVRLI
jgi:ubiquinone/menaquinone biosynthesis C-methylase UbiE